LGKENRNGIENFPRGFDEISPGRITPAAKPGLDRRAASGVADADRDEGERQPPRDNIERLT
jgi:hypothetical protein